jgi:hypothetical protein
MPKREKKMSDLLVINVWKKGTNQHTSMPDYHIEVKSGGIDYVFELVSALKGIGETNSKINKKKIDMRKERDKKGII